jgi:PAS domain-containing protein
MFDDAQFGVVSNDLKGRVSYYNKWVTTVLGRDLGMDADLFDVLADAESRRTLEVELQRREDGSSGMYTLVVRTPRRAMTVRVWATALRGENQQVVGSVAIITRAPLDELRAVVLKINISREVPVTALSKLDDALRPHYPFDGFLICTYDPSMEYTRVLYLHVLDVPASSMPWNKHWIALTPEQRAWVRELARGIVIDELSEFLSREEWRSLAMDPMVRSLLAADLRSAAGLLITEGSSIVASVFLLSRRHAAYDQEMVAELRKLCIDGVVLAVVNALRDREAAFRHELLRRLARSQNIEDLTNLVVRQVRQHYGYSRVHLYSINWPENHARLGAKSIGVRLKTYAPPALVPLDGGVIADVASSLQVRYLNDVSRDPEFAKLLWLDAGSAFCWPVRYQFGKERARWVFVAADQHTDAFPPAEQALLTDIASHIGGLLERLTELHFLRATFDATSDAILVVDGRNNVRRANRAAAQLFGFESPKELVGDVAERFQDAEEARAQLSACAATARLDIVDAAKAVIPIVVNSRTLPDSVGGKVLAFEDLRGVQRLEELRILGRVGWAISIQAQTPLTLSSSWIERLRAMLGRADDGTEIDRHSLFDLAERSLAQLRRIQACLDRVALYDADARLEARPTRPVSLGDEVQRTALALPTIQRSQLRIEVPEAPILVRIYPEHLHFVLDSVVSFFLRELADADTLDIVAGRHDGFGWMECRVSRAGTGASESARDRSHTSLAAELGLVERGLQQILAAYEGVFRSQRTDAGLVSAHVQVPLYKTLLS